MAHDVFISHANRDKSVADAACAALESAGIRCWIAPRDVQAGRSFAGEVTRAIQNGKIMVLIFSAHSNNSEQVLREVQLAADAHLHIIQFRIEEVTANDDLKYFLSIPHWLDAITPPLKTHLDRLVNSIKPLLAAVPSPIPAVEVAPGKPEIRTADVPSPPSVPISSSAEPKKGGFGFMTALVGFGLLLLGCIVWFALTGISHLRKKTESTSNTASAPTTPAPASVGAASSTDNSANKNDSQVYLQRGHNRAKKSDLDGALADYERALELDPQNSDAYNGRGTIQERKANFAEALKDYQKALEFNPRNAAALDNLGNVHRSRGEYDTALEDYDRSIAIDPTRVLTFVGRGKAKLMKGDIAGATADFNHAVELDPKNTFALEGRALFYMETQQWLEAADDLESRCQAEPSTQAYSRLLNWVAQSHLPNKALADRELAGYLNRPRRMTISDWYIRIGNFLLGKISPNDFLDPKNSFLQNDIRKRCQAWMFAGEKSLAHDDKQTAIGCFQNCTATNQKGSAEYRLAQSELKALGK